MSISISNKSKNAISLDNKDKTSNNTWDDAEMVWDDNEDTWDNQTTIILNKDKNTILLNNKSL